MATCLYPLRLPYAVVPCGRCNICRRNTAMDWTTRLILESKGDYKAMYFLTLTYKREPKQGLILSDLQRYLKRVRKKCNVRYFAVGEYGERFGRAHYHVIMFVKTGTLDHIVNSWKAGLVDVGMVSAQSCAYVANHSLKVSRQPSWKNPTFRVMSKRPGIGSNYLTREMRKYHIESLSTQVFDGEQFKRMPRYYRKKLFADADAKFIAERNTKQFMKAQEDLIRKLTRLGYRDPIKEIESRKKAFNQRLTKTKTKIL